MLTFNSAMILHDIANPDPTVGLDLSKTLPIPAPPSWKVAREILTEQESLTYLMETYEGPGFLYCYQEIIKI